MQLRSDIQLASMRKAMLDVVLPAIDPANRLAIEQAQLVVGMIGLMQHQLPLQYAFDRAELSRLLQTMIRLQTICEAEPALGALQQRCSRLIGESETVLRGSGVGPDWLVQTVRAAREIVGDIVSCAGQVASTGVLARIEQEVLDLSKHQLLRDRALVAPQGWEPDPAAVPSIQSLLSAGPQAAGNPIDNSGDR